MLLFNNRCRKLYTIFIAIVCLTSTVLEASADEIKDGTIVLSEWDGGDNCTIPFVSGIYRFNDNGAGYGCENNDKSTIDLNGVASATTVFLFDDKNCSKKDDQNYWVEFKTIKHPTNVKGLRIDKFFEKNKGEVVVPGVRLIDSYRRNDDSLKNKLSCVVIKRSDIP